MAGMIHLLLAPLPIHRPMIPCSGHAIQLRPLCHPNGAFTSCQVFLSQGIITLRQHPPLRHMQRLLSYLCLCIFSIAQQAPVSLIVRKVSFHASYLGIKERTEILTRSSNDTRSLSKHGICSAMSSANFPLLTPVILHTPCTRFLNISQVHLGRRTPRRVFCHPTRAARVRARNTTRC
ncbi:hypothetical protein B0F90DRAFT_1747009 [Multifurca ochricompacta]|uniref:Uncharacterized protein n=1 Tax=Multifurca ochricompacta TaxID=376703 RepID=A0AAD4QLA7_9AGAM|nr:hypothetical protein B0F90DRAFT_1756996 [Multifurca ochricompacta]KAI0296283.1 hypothetical protein B0F90DRAFT_1747009 [Multifurca ochricompacta]